MLDAEVAQLINDSHRPGTKQNLRSQINNYMEFCDRYRFMCVPADGKQVTRFAAYLHAVKNLNPRTIDNNVTAVRTLHGLLGFPAPDTSNYIHQAVRRGLRARNKKPVKKATPINPEIFRMIRPFVNMKDPLELVAWVAALMGFHCLLRASNITTKSRKVFDPQINLTRADFRMHNDMLLVHIRWTKTMQFQEKKLIIPVIPFTEGDISAVEWFSKMVKAILASPESPAFAVPTKTKSGV